ncbi:MAG: hypothetical protein V5A27_10860, partial [Halapricum sp.]
MVGKEISRREIIRNGIVAGISSGSILGFESVAASNNHPERNKKHSKARFIRDVSWTESQSVRHLQAIRDDPYFEEMEATIGSDGFDPL